jgi:tetratricopeptide (TPR) repeat protein
MFKKQIDKLKLAIDHATKINNLDEALEAFTAIINEKIKTKHKDICIAATKFLDSDDDRGDVYYRRAYTYEHLAKRALKQRDYQQALTYFRLSSSDTYEAMLAYQDLDKRVECRKQLREDQEAMGTIRKKLQQQTQKQGPLSPVSVKGNRKRSLDEESTASENSVFSGLRSRGMWNPKKAYDERLEALEKERLGAKRARHEDPSVPAYSL